MRVLSQYQFEHSIKFIGFDFEETTPPVLGLNGSTAYVDSSGGVKPYEQIEGVFNYEMIGYYSDEPNTQEIPFGFNVLLPGPYAMIQADSFRGNFIVSAANTASLELMNVYDSMAALYVPHLKVVSAGLSIVPLDFLRSDHASFWDNGYKAVMLTDGADYRNNTYHTPADTVGALNFTFMSNVVKAVVASVAELAKIRHSTSAVKQVTGPVNVREIGNDCNLNVSMGRDGGYLYFWSTCPLQHGSTLQLYDARGRLVTVWNVDPGTFQVMLPDSFTPGVYLAVIHGKQYHAAKRFIVIE
jgi:hypothetical protein